MNWFERYAGESKGIELHMQDTDRFEVGSTDKGVVLYLIPANPNRDRGTMTITATESNLRELREAAARMQKVLDAQTDAIVNGVARDIEQRQAREDDAMVRATYGGV